MITYERTWDETKKFYRYRKLYDPKYKRPMIMSAKQLPPVVLKQFQDTNSPSIDYDDHPDKPRCIFCEGYGNHVRIFMEEMIALCNDHYYSENIGKIAARMRVIHKEQADGILIEKSRTGRKKSKSLSR